jgi:hypothetical protein
LATAGSAFRITSSVTASSLMPGLVPAISARFPGFFFGLALPVMLRLVRR